MSRAARNRRLNRWRARAGSVGPLAWRSLALGPGLGCGREFFRQWADQDVSEAIFEKSRDPRWRLKTFLDRARRRCRGSPTPTTPTGRRRRRTTTPPRPSRPRRSSRTIRLMTPAEGTGYIEMLAAGPRYRAPPSDRGSSSTPGPPWTGPASFSGGEAGTPPTSPVPGPFVPGGPDWHAAREFRDGRRSR